MAEAEVAEAEEAMLSDRLDRVAKEADDAEASVAVVMEALASDKLDKVA